MIRDYVALDLEMTGLSPRKDAILEIGAVKVRDMEVTETYTAMVNPGFPVPEHVTEISSAKRGKHGENFPGYGDRYPCDRTQISAGTAEPEVR